MVAFWFAEILCLDPLNVTSAQIDTESIKYDTNVTITCDRGYQIKGLASDSTYCNVSAKWEPSLPPCDGNLHSILLIKANDGMTSISVQKSTSRDARFEFSESRLRNFSSACLKKFKSRTLQNRK